MSDVKNLISQLNLLNAGQVNFVPYNFADDIKIAVGKPPVPVVGIDSINVGFLAPRTKLIMGLNASGVFVTNRNLSGFIEMVFLDGVVTVGAIQVMETLGVPYPIGAMDIKSGGTSRILATSCRQVNTPTWRKSLRPSRTVITLHTSRLIMSTGIRLAETA